MLAEKKKHQPKRLTVAINQNVFLSTLYVQSILVYAMKE